jgi:hypothetical protein
MAWALMIAGGLGVLAGLIFGIAVPTDRMTGSEAFFARLIIILPSMLFGLVLVGLGYVSRQLSQLLARPTAPMTAPAPVETPSADPGSSFAEREPAAFEPAPAYPAPPVPAQRADARVPLPTPEPTLEKPAPLSRGMAAASGAALAGLGAVTAAFTFRKSATAQPSAETPVPNAAEPVTAVVDVTNSDAVQPLDENDLATQIGRALERRGALDIEPDEKEAEDDPVPDADPSAEVIAGPDRVAAAIAALTPMASDLTAAPTPAIDDLPLTFNLDLGDLDPEPVAKDQATLPELPDLDLATGEERSVEADPDETIDPPLVSAAPAELPATTPAPNLVSAAGTDRWRAPTVEQFVAQEPAAQEQEAALPGKVVREGQFAGRRYRMFENGSLEIDTDQSTLRFDSLDEFRSFVAGGSRP